VHPWLRIERPINIANRFETALRGARIAGHKAKNAPAKRIKRKRIVRRKTGRSIAGVTMKACLYVLLPLATAFLSFAPSFAQGQPPPNTISCDAFTKQPNGAWYVNKLTTFDFGNAKNMTLQDQEISPGAFNFSGFDLYTAIELKCSGKRT